MSSKNKKNIHASRGLNALCIGACSLALSTISQAVDYTWLGGTGLWNTTNWSDGVNTVAGPTSSAHTAIINSGTVQLSGDDMFGNGGSATATTAIQVNNGATLDTNGKTNPIVGLALNGGNLLINGGNSATWGGVRLSGTLTAGGSAASTISSTGDLTRAWIGVGNNTVKDLTLSIADATGNSNADLTIHSKMIEGNWGANPHGIIKIGAGTVALAHANNTYQGESKIQEGALLLEGANTGGGLVTVSSGAKLGGNGSTTSAVTVQTGGKLGVDISDWTGSAGTGFTDFQIGSLNCAGTWVVSLTSSTAYANFTEGPKTFAFLNVTGTSNFNPLNVTVDAEGFPGTGSWSVQQTGQVLELLYSPSGDTRLATTTELVSSLNPSQDNDSVTFTATVKVGASIATNAGADGGTVEFRLNGNLVTTDSFVNGVATYTTNTLPPGPNSITANYTGNLTTYKPSSASLTQTNESPHILTFNFGSYGAATIDGLNITKTVPYLTNPATLPAATYTLSDGATCTPASGVIQDFSSPVQYTVKSADESITKIYTVTVTVAPEPVYTWQGGAGNWNSLNWLLNDGGVTLLAGPTGPSNARTAVINSGTVAFSAHDTFGMGNTLSSPVIHVNDATLSSGGFFTTIWNLNLDSGIILLNGGAAEAFPAFQLAGTLTATGTSAVNVGSGNFNKINLGGSGNATLTIDTPAPADAFTVNGPLKNSSYGGSLTKTGAGTLTLAGVNTYTGNTTVADGLLVLADDAGLKFIVTDASSNQITGAGTATLDGDFTIDTSAVTLTPPSAGSWVLVNTSNYSFTSNFTVAGWTETSNVWSMTDGNNNLWQFIEATGTLTLNDGAPPVDDYLAWDNLYAADLSDKNADNDGDGMSNFEEYAFGLNPTSGASVNPITDLSTLKSAGSFSYTRRAGTGLNYTIWVSTDLVDWGTEPVAADQEAGAVVDGVETVLVTLPSIPTAAKFFVRVKAN